MSPRALAAGARRGCLTVVARGQRRSWLLRWDGCGHEAWVDLERGKKLLRAASEGRASARCRHPAHGGAEPETPPTWKAPAAEPAQPGTHLLLRTATGHVTVLLAALDDDEPGLADPRVREPARAPCAGDRWPALGAAWLLDPCAESDELDAAHDAADALARSRDPAERAEGERRQAILRGLEDERAAAILRRECGLAPDAELPPGMLDARRRTT